MIASRIRDARVASDLTQRELGERVGVDAATVSRWERGEHEPSIRTIDKIAVVTNRSVAWFFTGEVMA